MESAHDYLHGSTGREIAFSITSAVREGRLAGGERLPPVRTAAAMLGVSAATVGAAWGMLSRAGVIETGGRRGTHIRSANAHSPRRYRRALDRRTVFARDLSTGVPDADLLPDLRRSLRRVRLPGAASYLDDCVLPELADVLRDNWPYEPETFTVLDGAMDALDQIVSRHLQYGDRVAVEQPAFPPLLDLLDAVGTEQVGVDCDAHGPLPDSLDRAIERGVRAFVFQPRAQNPTGASMTVARARELASLLRPHEDLVVIEDDSAGSIANSADISLGRWLPDSVLHVRSFSKSHGPDLRMAAVSGSHRLLDPVIDRRYLGQGWSSRLLQSVLLDLLTDDDARQQGAKARVEYARRRTEMIKSLKRLGRSLPRGDGLNLWLPVEDETATLLHLASHGIGAAAGGPFWLDPASAAPHIRLTVGLVRNNFDELAEIFAGGAQLDTSTGPR